MLYGFKILLDGFKIVMLLCSFSLAEMYYEVIKNCSCYNLWLVNVLELFIIF